ncbi:MAG: FkbM family methyltransferase [Flavobacteriales bacterium]|nr:FkbM family methyltransferase [Flavobacteriales bacterium]
MSVLKKAVRGSLRWFAHHVPIRGRHRLADSIGHWAADPQTKLELNGVVVELDRDIQFHRMMMYGLYEENILNYLRRHLKPGMVAFDPGCNIGYLAAELLGMVGPTGQVWSFEPSPTCQARIFRLNDPDKVPGWHFQAMALTDRTGRMTFYDTPRVVTHGYAALENAQTPNDRIPVEVEVSTIDDFCLRHGIERIDFLKLDIEESELPALKGATRMLAKGAIRSILVETSFDPGSSPVNEELFRLLRSAGFRPHHVHRDGTLVLMEPERMPEGHKEDIIWERTTG